MFQILEAAIVRIGSLAARGSSAGGCLLLGTGLALAGGRGGEDGDVQRAGEVVRRIGAKKEARCLCYSRERRKHVPVVVSNVVLGEKAVDGRRYKQ
jgi:hypothetical protein